MYTPDIRLARVTTNTSGGVTTISVNTSNSTDDQLQSTSSGLAHQTLPQTIAAAGSSPTAPTQLTSVDGRCGTGGSSSTAGGTTSLTQNTAPGTIVTIKQEQLATVDNLVGSFVDSTTFLHSPSNSQMVNPNHVQNNCGAGGNNAEASAGDLHNSIQFSLNQQNQQQQQQICSRNKTWKHLTDLLRFCLSCQPCRPRCRRHTSSSVSSFGHFSQMNWSIFRFTKTKRNGWIRFSARYLYSF